MLCVEHYHSLAMVIADLACDAAKDLLWWMTVTAEQGPAMNGSGLQASARSLHVQVV